MFTIDLPQQIETRLLILAMSTGRTIDYCAREAILDYIDEIEERCLARQGRNLYWHCAHHNEKVLTEGSLQRN